MSGQPHPQATVDERTAQDPPAGPPSPNDPSSERTLRYQLVAEIGRGGMGVVFRGYDPSRGPLFQ